jgi:alkaline phosphatase D
MDAWDGYPAARERLLASARAADANLIVLSGDSHNAWANQLTSAGAPAGVELAGTSVTSPGAENSLSWLDPAKVAADTVALNPGLTWCDTRHRGYLALELTPARATGEYRLLDTIRQRSTRLANKTTLATEPGRNRFVA